MSRICCSALGVHVNWTLDRPKSQRTADARHDESSIAARKHPLQVGAVDLDAGKAGPARDLLYQGRKGLDIGHGRDRAGVRDPATAGDTGEVDSRRGVARLPARSEEHTSELQSRSDLVCRLLLEKKKKNHISTSSNTKKKTHQNNRK